MHYFIASILIGGVTLGLALYLRRKRAPMFGNLILTFLVISWVVLIDRYLLVCFGLPIWIADPVVHFRHRPNAVRTWPPEYTRGYAKPVRINAYGHHDDPFPVKKPAGEFRAVVLGDSVTMGHGVTREETYSNQLEDLLNKHDQNYATHQIINTGVSGYAPRQEYYILKESMIFQPDLVLVGFCMNDVTEPFTADRNLGGTGFGNQGISQLPNIFWATLYHETGWGRLINYLNWNLKVRQNDKLREIYNVQYMSKHFQDDVRIQKAWDVTLADLEKIYQLCHANDLPVILLIFPHTFQLSRNPLKISPQKILTDHARRFHVPVIDLTFFFQQRVAEKIMLMREQDCPPAMIQTLINKYLLTYFLDWDHLTVEGHQVVARAIFDFLVKKKIIAIR